MIPDPVQKFIEAFSKLPSIGPRMATRLAFYLVGLPRGELQKLEAAFSGLKNLGRCPQCFFISAGGLCHVCRDPKRDKLSIAVVEKETDLLSLERTGKWNGHYLVLGSPERGMIETSQKLRLGHLKARIQKDLGGPSTGQSAMNPKTNRRGQDKIKEIVIALNPNAFGDYATEVIIQEFKDLAEKITRLGRGIPTGGEVEFADEETLASALERRS